MLECPEITQMKDFLKLFKTIIDFKGLPFLVTKQSTIKKLRLLFFWPWLNACYQIFRLEQHGPMDGSSDQRIDGRSKPLKELRVRY